MARRTRTLTLALIVATATSAQGQIINQSLSGSGASQPGATPTPATEPARGPLSWMVPKVTLPKIAMPKIEMPKLPANAFAPIKASAAKVKSGTRKAWDGAKEILTFGRGKSEPTARVASREQPSVLQRMFSGGETQSYQPQTVSEFIQQPRPQ